MKLFDVFNRAGDKIGEIHQDGDSGDGCLVGAIIALIAIVGGIAVWPYMFSSMEDEQLRAPIIVYLVVVIVTDVICVLVRVFFMRYSSDEFGELFWGFLLVSTIIVSIVMCLIINASGDVFNAFVGEISVANVVALVVVTLLVQIIPSLIMTVITRAIR